MSAAFEPESRAVDRTRIFENANIVLPAAVLIGWIAVSGDRIVEVGEGRAPNAASIAPATSWFRAWSTYIPITWKTICSRAQGGVAAAGGRTCLRCTNCGICHYHGIRFRARRY